MNLNAMLHCRKKTGNKVREHVWKTKMAQRLCHNRKKRKKTRQSVVGQRNGGIPVGQKYPL